MCTRHPDLVSLDFMSSIYSQNFCIYLSPLIFNLLIILLQVSSNATSSKKYYVVGSLDYSCIRMYMNVEKCMSTQAHGIGGLLANTVHCKLEVTVSVLFRLDSPHFPRAASRVADSFMVNLAFLHARSRDAYGLVHTNVTHSRL